MRRWHRTHAAATACVTGATAERAEPRNYGRFWQDVPGHAALRFSLFAVEPCLYMDKAALLFFGQLGDVASCWSLLAGGVSKARPCSGRCACSLNFVSLQKGTAIWYGSPKLSSSVSRVPVNNFVVWCIRTQFWRTRACVYRLLHCGCVRTVIRKESSAEIVCTRLLFSNKSTVVRV